MVNPCEICEGLLELAKADLKNFNPWNNGQIISPTKDEFVDKIINAGVESAILDVAPQLPPDNIWTLCLRIVAKIEKW